MATKQEIIDQLVDAGIDHDPEDTKSNLEALLPDEKSAGKSKTETIGDIEVGDPQLLRPVELPLVVKPADGGEWKNDSQAEYATYLNAYAYKNPKKWAAKKKVLIGRLAEIGSNAEAITKYKGHDDGGVQFSDQRIAPKK